MEAETKSRLNREKVLQNVLSSGEIREWRLHTGQIRSRAGSVHKQIQSQQQSRRNSQDKVPDTLDNNKKNIIEEIRQKFAKFSQIHPSSVSRYSRESNGFQNKIIWK